MKIILKIRRLAEAQSKGNLGNPDFKNIPVIPLKENILKEDAFETRIKKAIKMFYEIAKYIKPICFGFRPAFPDGDEICENCPRYTITKKINKEIEDYAKYLQNTGLSETEAREKAIIMFSCRDASDERIREYNLELIQKTDDIKRNFGEDRLRLEKTLEPIKQKYERENREKVKERERKIEELMKGG